MATFSQAMTGVRSDYVSTNENVTLPDAVVPSSGVTISTATVGAMANSMQNNRPMLCRNADGSQSWYTLDAERSTPTVPVLKAVGP